MFLRPIYRPNALLYSPKLEEYEIVIKILFELNYKVYEQCV